MKTPSLLKFFRKPSLLGLVAASVFTIAVGLVYTGFIPEDAISWVILLPTLVIWFFVMGYAGCDIKGGLSASCQFWSFPVGLGAFALEVILVYFVFALIERLFRGAAALADSDFESVSARD